MFMSNRENETNENINYIFLLVHILLHVSLGSGYGGSFQVVIKITEIGSIYNRSSSDKPDPLAALVITSHGTSSVVRLT